MKFDRHFAPAGFDIARDIVYQERTSEVRDASGKLLRSSEPFMVPEKWSITASDMLIGKFARRAGVPDWTAPVAEEFIPRWLQRSVPVAGCKFGGERHAAQVFRRLAGCWTYHGWKAGYFGPVSIEMTNGEFRMNLESEEFARNFYDDICWLLAYQFAAPNSPQWFNTGLNWAYGIQGDPCGLWKVMPPEMKARQVPDNYSHPVSSACFIQSVEDSLLGSGSIMDLWEREARVFKMGSGSGVNYSRLRARGEPLSGGGTSSGLLSWLGIGDRAAGAIKSGGTTRRAARMVILDDDHPDLLEFIWWKVREEEKVAAMAAGSHALRTQVDDLYSGLKNDGLAVRGTPLPPPLVDLVRRAVAESRDKPELSEFDFAFEGSAYQTVGGQNANNSVRISDQFMRAAHNKEQWTLHGRVSSKVNKEIRADQIFDDICEAAWRCADPGLHFRDAVNFWNTCPADGEIEASNPCQPGFATVMTPTGIKTFDDIDVGSIIWSGRQWTTVVRKVNSGVKPVFSFRTKAGRFIGTADHMVYCRGKKVKACEAREIDRAWEPEQIPRGAEVITDEEPCPVLEVVPLGDYHVWDITVDAEDHSYWTGGMLVSNCGEFLWLNGGSCNLASLRLTAFLAPSDGNAQEFDAARFKAAVRLWTVVLDISVEMSAFPSQETAESAYKYRTLGLGYSDLGALLMRMGLAYDSLRGRALAGGITALMHFTAWNTSALLAGSLGAFPRYRANESSVWKVLTNHGCLLEGKPLPGLHSGDPHPLLLDRPLVPADLLDLAEQTYRDCLSNTKEFGLRNAQLTLLAPCGTIGLVMDCDTTGIEPDFALVKYKTLAGGGCLKIVNQSIIPALLASGLTTESACRLAEEILHTGDIPALFDFGGGPEVVSRDVREVLATANKIHWRGHLAMMATVQPFLSGGISKTINLPREATVDDVKELYRTACVRRLKDVALYRDQSKLSQPLSSAPSVPESLVDPARPPEAVKQVLGPAKVAIKASLPSMTPRSAESASMEPARVEATRQKLPGRRNGYTQKLRVGGAQSLFLRTGEYPDGRLGEIFIDLAKQGSTMRSICSCFAIAVSLGLQHGVPLEEYVDAFVGCKFEPDGIVQGHDSIKFAASIFDAVFRDLGINYLGRHYLGNISPAALMDDSFGGSETEGSQEANGATGRHQGEANDPDWPDTPLAGIDAPEAANGSQNGCHSGGKPGSKQEVSQVPVRGNPPVKSVNPAASPETEIASKPDMARSMGYSGDACRECGSFRMVRNGPCCRCEHCGASSGCS